MQRRKIFQNFFPSMIWGWACPEIFLVLNKSQPGVLKNWVLLIKIVIPIIFSAFALSLLILTVLKYRFWETILTFLLVWYYCTLTIRESILTVNGSRIKGW